MHKGKLVAIVSGTHLLLSLGGLAVAGASSLACMDRPCTVGERLALGATEVLSFPIVFPMSDHIPGYHGTISTLLFSAVNCLLWGIAIVRTVRRFRGLYLRSDA
jgi:hypothetical protein